MGAGAVVVTVLHLALVVLGVVASSTDEAVFTWIWVYGIAGAAASAAIAWAVLGDHRATWLAAAALLVVTAAAAVLMVIADPVAGLIITVVGFGSLLYLHHVARSVVTSPHA